MSPSFEPTTYLCQGLTELTFGHPSNFDNFCCCFSLLLFCKVILRCTHILKTDVFSFYLSISLSPFSLWVHWRLYIRVLLLSIVESSTRLHNKATRPSTFLSLSRGWNISFVADCKYWWGLSKELCICQTLWHGPFLIVTLNYQVTSQTLWPKTTDHSQARHILSFCSFGASCQ